MKNITFNQFNCISLPIMIVDTNGILIHANTFFLEYFNLASHSIVGKHWVDIIVLEEQREHVHTILIQYKNAHLRQWEIESDCHLIESESYRSFRWKGSSCTQYNDLILIWGEETTTLKHYELTLFKEKQKERAILDSTDNIILEDNGEEIIECNAKFLEFFGVKSLEQFKEKNKGLISLFIESKNFFHQQLLEKEENWIDHMHTLSESGRVVSMLDAHGDIHALKVGLHKFNRYSHIITMTDITDLMNEKNKFEHDANHDALTAIYNRRKFNEILSETLLKKSANQFNHALLMFDIDHFKLINDTYGHEAGDMILVEVVQTVKKRLRQNDIFGRWGGEEFMILLNDTVFEDALLIAEELRNRIEKHKNNSLPSITASFGITPLHLNDTLKLLLKRVDYALYEAKENGRNQVSKA